MTKDAERALLAGLASTDWNATREAAELAGDSLSAHALDDRLRGLIAARLLHLAGHKKWEVRKAVAHAALFLPRDSFHATIGRIVEDENAWVRDAARKTLQRREQLVRSDVKDDEGDAILGLLGVAQARYGKRVRRTIEQIADRLHNRFVRQAWHETTRIIAPLDIALVNLETEIAATFGAPDSALVHIRRAQARVRLMSCFLENLRDFTAGMKLAFAPENLSSILRTASELAEGAIERPDLSAAAKFVFDLDETLTIEADLSVLLQAFVNLIVNAVEACADTGRFGEIRVCGRRQHDGGIAITIADNGCGMNEEALADCVLLYSTCKPQGMGFGLPMAKKIIETLHHGRLSIDSRSGIGTVVTVVLPAEQNHGED